MTIEKNVQGSTEELRLSGWLDYAESKNKG